MDHCRSRSSHTCGASRKGHSSLHVSWKKAPDCNAMGSSRHNMQPLPQAAGLPGYDSSRIMFCRGRRAV